MEINIIVVLVFAVALIGGGYYLATHLHSKATEIATAITRATTIPSGDVAALNAKVDNLGTTLATLTTHVGTLANTGVAAAAAAAPTTPTSAPTA